MITPNTETVNSNENNGNVGVNSNINPNNNSNNNLNSNTNTNNNNNSNMNNDKLINNNNKSENLKHSNEKKKSHAVLYMFLSIIGILAIILSLVACFAKYKNTKHERAMKQSLLRNRLMLQKYNSEEDTFFKDTAVRSMDDQFTLSKYSESASNVGSHVSSHAGNEGGTRSKVSNINTNNYEHAILMENVDGIPKSSTLKDGSYEFDNDMEDGGNLSLSRTIDVSLSDASYSLTTNPYTSTTYSEFYDSSYCSTCDTSESSSQSSFTTNSSLSLTHRNSKSISGSYTSSSRILKNNSTNNILDEVQSNITLDSTLNGGYDYNDNKNYMTKRSIISNTSGRTLINRTGSSNAGTSTCSVLSSSAGTVTTATTRYMEEDNMNMKMVLEDIAEENSMELSKANKTIDLSLDDSSLGKGLNISYIFKDNSFFNDSHKQEENFTLNW
ncbi:hypothetical protein PIROE2DRAFT_18593 [Piromyces sp. E2]|nr:hypothetical protein PIROE2DRAFT_18593 [Piromyces sp. E2]|eukprot:OUM56685.1 hypothetical protein PIROE2DRAFT_18593 [Piromyces sp. E2]